MRIPTLVLAFLAAAPLPASAQTLDMSRGGPLSVSANDGIDWNREERTIVAHGDARATRDKVTVLGTTLTAWYRSKSGAAPAAAPNSPPDESGSEIYKVQALGAVRIFTETDQVTGDRAVYDIDQAVLVMTGGALKLTTPTQMLTARDTLEYWSQKRMAVARGNAVVLTNDGRRIAADTLVAYTAPDDAPPTAKPAKAASPNGEKPADPLSDSGKLQKMEAIGNVNIRTATDTITGDRAVYIPETGMARIGGKVRITRGQNQIMGSEAIVNMKTGVARLVSGGSGRVSGLVVPNDPTNNAAAANNPAGTAAAPRPTR